MKPLGTIGIVGLGLIGASLGMAIRQRTLAGRVVGIDVDAATVALGKQRGAVDAGATTLGALREADLVVVAVPSGLVIDVARRVAAEMKPHSVLTDVASTKVAIVEELERTLPPHVHYVGGHPMAGSEARGAANADAALLVGRPFLLTTTERTDPQAVTLLKDLVERLGMQPVLLAPAEHDELVAQVSHLPYLLAIALVNAASDAGFEVRGPVFSDFLRIARSPAEMWAEICQTNRAAIMRALQRFRGELEQLERVLGDAQSLEPVLERSRQRSLAVTR